MRGEFTSSMAIVEEHMREIGHFIGGEHVGASGGRSGQVFNPATGEVDATVALASKARSRTPRRRSRPGLRQTHSGAPAF
jgi:hypothetical protein